MIKYVDEGNMRNKSKSFYKYILKSVTFYDFCCVDIFNRNTKYILKSVTFYNFC